MRAIGTFMLSIIAAAMTAILSVGAAQAQSSPFAELGGTWRGGGSLQLANGKRERLQCRAYYTPRQGGARMGMALRCASPSMKLELRSRLNYSNGLVSGSWSETTFNNTGSLRGRASRSRITLQIGGSVSGALRVSISGNRQNVSFNTSGGQLRGVNISLSRG
jgi:hypothetical protein